MPHLLANFKTYDFEKKAVRDNFHNADISLARIMLKRSVGLGDLIYKGEDGQNHSLLYETDNTGKIKVLLEFMTPDAYIKAINPVTRRHILSDTDNVRKAELILKKRRTQNYPISVIIDNNSLLENTNNIKIAELLISYGENVNRVDNNKKNIFEKTISNEKILWLLTKGVDANMHTSEGMPFLKHIENKKDLLLTILNTIAIVDLDLDNPDKKGQPLLYSIKDKELRFILIKKGADVNRINNKGFPPLLFIEDNDTCEVLIDKGANLNFQDRDAKNLFLLNAKNMTLNKFNFLLNKCVNIEKKDFKGNAMIHYLVQSGVQFQKEKLSAYCQSGKDLNIRDNNGDNLLIYLNNYKILDDLFGYGLNLRNKDNNGEFTLIKKLASDYPIEVLSKIKNVLLSEPQETLLKTLHNEIKNLHISYSVLSFINRNPSPLLKSINEIDFSKLLTTEKSSPAISQKMKY